MKDRVRNNKLNNLLEEKRFRVQERYWLHHSLPPTIAWNRVYRGPQLRNPTGPTTASTVVKVFTLAPHVINWSLEPSSVHCLPRTMAYDEESFLWTCAKRAPTTLGGSDSDNFRTQYLTFNLWLTKFSLHVPPTQRRQRCSNIESSHIWPQWPRFWTTEQRLSYNCCVCCTFGR